jgi:hypothetical protein
VAMLTLNKILDLLPMVLAILTGMLAYKKLPSFYRILFIQVLIFTAIDLYAASKPNNAWIFNISTIIEIGLVFLAADTYFNMIKSRLIILSLFLIFLLCFIFDIYSLGSKHFVEHAYIIGGILITGTYLTILSFHFFERKDKYHTSALVLTCLGVVLYFAGIEPYLSMIKHIQDPQANTKLFNLIIVKLGDIRYFLLALSFLILAQPFRFNLLKKVS